MCDFETLPAQAPQNEDVTSHDHQDNTENTVHDQDSTVHCTQPLQDEDLSTTKSVTVISTQL